MKRILFIITLLVGINAEAQIMVDKSLAKESIEGLIPAAIRNAIAQVDALEPNEDGKVEVSGLVLKYVKAGAARINKLAQIEAAEKSESDDKAKSAAFDKLGEGKVAGLPKPLREKFEDLSKIEKQVILDFFKAPETPAEAPAEEPAEDPVPVED